MTPTMPPNDAAQKPTWTVYILGCADHTLYTGITTHLRRRLEQHNAARAARYTRGRLPLRLLYAEPAADRASASRREQAIKRLSRAQKLALIAAHPTPI